jgi:hypothetical protein
MTTPILALLLALSPPSGDAPDPAPYLATNTPCPEAAAQCLDLALFLATDGEGNPVQDPEWIGGGVAATNRLFDEVGIHFTLATVTFLSSKQEVVHSKADRDRLGHDRWSKGPIHWFVVGRLDNVDEDGEIYGVHWRDRKATHHRWVILSKISWPFTLPHELGHFFGLSHNAILGSIMNKAGNDSSRMSTRRFTETELPVIRKHLARKLKKGELVDRKIKAGTKPPGAQESTGASSP